MKVVECENERTGGLYNSKIIKHRRATIDQYKVLRKWEENNKSC